MEGREGGREGGSVARTFLLAVIPRLGHQILELRRGEALPWVVFVLFSQGPLLEVGAGGHALDAFARVAVGERMEGGREGGLEGAESKR
jgi:hypothetical protein